MVFRRLQELDIPCFCETHKPLEVHASNPTAIIQLWSVTKQYSASRQELIDWLQDCWHFNKR
ncbi:Asr1405/Asl0597 family protein [Crocosphaera sp. Alani8]|uniref:Asr1405/Asl0597 family protein n=1 Tax=Crocosphaera sp. Alani8 TaxID=3038952 RepID=UPI00313B1581